MYPLRRRPREYLARGGGPGESKPMTETITLVLKIAMILSAISYLILGTFAEDDARAARWISVATIHLLIAYNFPH